MKNLFQKTVAFLLAVSFLNPAYSEVPALGYAFKFRSERSSSALQAAKPTSSPSVLLAADADTKCRRFRTMRNAGIGLVIAGPTSFVTGVTLVALGYSSLYNGGDGPGEAGLIAGGAMLITFGILMTGAGIPLTIIGSKKSKQWCDQRQGELKMNLKGNGVGFAYRF